MTVLRCSHYFLKILFLSFFILNINREREYRYVFQIFLILFYFRLMMFFFGCIFVFLFLFIYLFMYFYFFIYFYYYFFFFCFLKIFDIFSENYERLWLSLFSNVGIRGSCRPAASDEIERGKS